MNFLNLILNSRKTETVCFFCLKDQKNTTSIFSKIEVVGDSINVTLTLAKMLKEIVPSHEILFDEACKDCSNLILKMFITLHKYNRNLAIINLLLKNLDEQVNDVDPIKIEQVFIRLNTPEVKETIEEKICTITNKTFDCDKCDLKFSTKNLLKEHNKTLHRNSHDATVCDICGQTFKTSSSLKAHANCHKFRECPYCFKVLKSHSHFSVHIKRHRSDVKRKRNKLYYNCDNCSYVTVNKKTLEAHVNKIHLDIRPYICEACYKGFYKKSHLTEHLKTHEQIKNKTCEICGDHFVNHKTLNEHLRLHSNTKPYECSICDKRFVTSGRRSDHIKRTHMEKTQCCLFCDKKFSLRKELNRHVKKIHTEGKAASNDNFNMNISNYKFDDTLVLPIT